VGYLRGIASQIDRPKLEAQVEVRGLEVVTRLGQVGRELDLTATLTRLGPPISRMHDADIELVVEERPPQVSDASEAAALAEEILRHPLVLTVEGEQAEALDPAELAAMLRFEPAESSVEITHRVFLDSAALRSRLQILTPELSQRAANARFIFNDDSGELELIQPAVEGRRLDLEASTEAIQHAVSQAEHRIPLVFQREAPEVGNEATAEELGLREPVSVVSTYFSGSGPARIQNIRTAAAAFHGLLVPPGETLSMAEVLGDISLDKGYAEALIIYGDRTIKGVGGGVCQVSTTLFRAAFFGGYPIVERHPHAYRVSFYEQGANSPGPGLDATVFVPVVDFRFTNDRPDWLLLETYVYGSQLVWKFYSTSDGRSVEWDSKAYNRVEAPEPLYRENPELPKGEIEKVDWEADGLDVSVTRTVRRAEQVLYEDVFQTHYLPWQAIYEYGPGTELPEEAQKE
jgi:vancomycin resistance protein YoaR